MHKGIGFITLFVDTLLGVTRGVLFALVQVSLLCLTVVLLAVERVGLFRLAGKIGGALNRIKPISEK